MLIVVPFCHFWLIKHSQTHSLFAWKDLFLQWLAFLLLKAVPEEDAKLQIKNKSFFSLPKIHKSWHSQPRRFIFTALKREFVEDSVDYPECAEWWIANKVCRRRRGRSEGLYSDVCTRTVLSIAKQRRISRGPDNEEKPPVSNNLHSNPNYPLPEVVSSTADILSIVHLSARHPFSTSETQDKYQHPPFICQGLQPDRIPPPLSFNAAIPHKKRSPQPDEICDMGRRGRRASCVRKSVEVNGKWRRKTFCSPSKRTGRIRRVAFRRLFSGFHFPEWPQNGCDSHFNCSVGRPWKVQSDRGEGVWGKGGALCRCREQNPISELDNHIQTVSDMRGHCA